MAAARTTIEELMAFIFILTDAHRLPNAAIYLLMIAAENGKVTIILWIIFLRSGVAPENRTHSIKTD
jgi:hypothetical protein